MAPVLTFEPREPILCSDEELPSEEDWEEEEDEKEDKEDEASQAFDDFGFQVPPEADAMGVRARDYAQWFEPKALRRRQRFEARREQLSMPVNWTALPKTRLKALLRKGVPAEHRAEVWWSVLGCESRRENASCSFAGLLAQDLPLKTRDEIERDLSRTFPSNRMFKAKAAHGRGQLRRVLRAFAIFNQRVQYCQGLNFIAALLLIVFCDEERAFWALVGAIDYLGVEEYYTEGMTLLRADMVVLSSVLERKCPKVARAFRVSGVELMSFCSEWYITWFSRCLPVSTILRVWDTLFFEGFKVLFRVALGVFKRTEQEILRCGSFENIMESSKSWPRCMIEHNELIKASFRGVSALRRKDLLQARLLAYEKIAIEDEEHRRRREAVCQAREEKRAAEAEAAALLERQRREGPAKLTAAGLAIEGGVIEDVDHEIPQASKVRPVLPCPTLHQQCEGASGGTRMAPSACEGI
jgi:hypothetical protein